MLTPEQETYLAAFADKGIAFDGAEAARIAQVDADRKAEQERNSFIVVLKAQKNQEIIAAIAEYDAALVVSPPIEVIPE